MSGTENNNLPSFEGNLAQKILELFNVASTSELRAYLQGVKVEQFADHWEIVSTDGYKLTRYQYAGKIFKEPRAAIIANNKENKQSLQYLATLKIVPSDVAFPDDTNEKIEIRGITLQLVTRDYPKIASVIPSRERPVKMRVSFNVDYLLELVKSTGMKKTGANRVVTLSLDKAVDGLAPVRVEYKDLGDNVDLILMPCKHWEK